jgi:hypothetical protein
MKASASTRTVRRRIQTLIEHHLIAGEPRYRYDGSCSSNTYRLAMAGGDKLSPAPDKADSTPGRRCQGDPDIAVMPRITRRTQNEPPQPQAETNEPVDRGGGIGSDLDYLKNLLSAVCTEAASVIDSLAIETISGRSILRYAHHLVGVPDISKWCDHYPRLCRLWAHFFMLATAAWCSSTSQAL